MTATLINLDLLRAERIARSPRFEIDPVGLYNELVGEVGRDRAGEIWIHVCVTYDRARGVEGT